VDEEQSAAAGRPDLTATTPFLSQGTRRASVWLLLLAAACVGSDEGSGAETPGPTPVDSVRVVGSIRVGFMPGSDAAELPSGPLEDVTLVIDALTNPLHLRHPAGDPDPDWRAEGEDLVRTTFDFEVSLPPGTYQSALLEVVAPQIARDPVPLPMSLLEFTLPRTGCVYIGRVSASYYRLPAGTLSEQRKAFDALTRRVGLDPLHEDIYVQLESGGLVPEFGTMDVDLPPDGERPDRADDCPVLPAAFVDLTE
jgi:hypothetical protein